MSPSLMPIAGLSSTWKQRSHTACRPAWSVSLHGGLEGEIAVVHGVPFQEMLDTAKKQQVDLIIMGTHGRTGLQHVLMGSVAEKVVRLAPCPVLVVRQPTLVPIA